jgi:SET domain-containing protein
MIHPSTELKFINEEIGYGVVATEFIPAGTITWVMDKLDREFQAEEFEAFDQLHKDILDIYSFRNSKGNYVLCWDNGRFVNHSFNSNCLSTAYDFEMAIRDILPGEQLTDDYGYLNINEPFQAADEGTERKTVYPDDLLRYSNEWDQKLKKVFSKIPKVNQPLLKLLSAGTKEEVNAVISKQKEMRSIRELYYDPAQTVSVG